MEWREFYYIEYILDNYIYRTRRERDCTILFLSWKEEGKLYDETAPTKTYYIIKNYTTTLTHYQQPEGGTFNDTHVIFVYLI